jgi:hypothetical protein
MHPSRLRPTLLAALAAVLVLLLLPAVGAAAPATTAIPLDGTQEMKVVPAPFQVFPNGQPTGPLAEAFADEEHGLPDLILTLYDDSGLPEHAGPFLVPFWKEYVGEHSDVYVGWDNLAAPPQSYQQDQTITPEQVAHMGAEFDARIWASDVAHFGWYDFRAPEVGMDGSRAAIMVYNIRDQAYWLEDYPWYIAGYFWGGLNDEIQMNCIFVDSYNWKDRIGGDSLRPYLYEGTVAHEFQHLIHNDVDGGEFSFIDEGMASLAMQFIYGPSVSASDLSYALYYHRDSLTDWDGELYDYGNTEMWQDYLWERAGGGDLFAPLDQRIKDGYSPFDNTADKFVDPGDAFTWNLIHDQGKGLEGVANQVGGMAEVEKLHRDWTLANLLDGKVSEPRWNYRNLVLGGADSEFTTIQDGIKFYNAEVGGNMPLTRKNVWRNAATEPWGAYYRNFYGSAPGLKMDFTGPATDGVAAVVGGYEWYSGLGNMLDISVARQVYGVAAGSTFTFQTWYDIEDQWDYGYVEGSANGTDWVPLQQVSALPAATDNMNNSSAWNGPGGLTGNSGGWQAAEYSFGDLSGTVWLRFRYMTDEAANGTGWYVDDVQAGSYVDDDTEAGWTNNGFIWTNGLQNNDWTADAYVPVAKSKRRAYAVVSLVGTDGQGLAGGAWVSAQYTKQFRITAVMSNRPDGVFNSIGRLTVKKVK